MAVRQRISVVSPRNQSLYRLPCEDSLGLVSDVKLLNVLLSVVQGLLCFCFSAKFVIIPVLDNTPFLYAD